LIIIFTLLRKIIVDKAFFEAYSRLRDKPIQHNYCQAHLPPIRLCANYGLIVGERVYTLITKEANETGLQPEKEPGFLNQKGARGAYTCNYEQRAYDYFRQGLK
jgi:hypothetical protein